MWVSWVGLQEDFRVNFGRERRIKVESMRHGVIDSEDPKYINL